MTPNFTVVAMVSLFLLTCLLRGMTWFCKYTNDNYRVSTHMPLARHDGVTTSQQMLTSVSTHMPLARHDG